MHPRDSLDPLREELIAALHSDTSARERLLASMSPDLAKSLAQVCRPYDYYSDDPRMEAAYYLSMCPISALLTVVDDIAELLLLPPDGESMNGNISFHLLKCIDRLVQEHGFSPSEELQRSIQQHSY